MAAGGALTIPPTPMLDKYHHAAAEPSEAPLIRSETIAGAATVLLFGMAAVLMLCQWSPNFQIEYDVLGLGGGQLPAWSLWGGVRQAWEHDAKMMAVVVAIWSGFWPP